MRERKIADIFAICIIVIYIILIICSHRQPVEKIRDISDYNSGWTLQYGDEQMTVDLPQSLKIPENTTVTLTNRIPQDFTMDCGIRFRTRMQRAEVYVDGTLIYTYPSEKLADGIFPSNWSFVRLPDKCGGKVIEIRLESPYSEFSGRLPEVSIGNYNNLISTTTRNYVPSFRLSMFFGMVGVVIILLSVIFSKYGIQEYQRTLGIMLLFVAIWLCGESRMPLSFLGLEAQYFITMGSLLVCPVFILAYVLGRWELKDWPGKLLFYVSISWACLSMVMQIFGILDFPETLPVSHGLLILVLIYTVFTHIRMVRIGKASKSELVCALLIVLAVTGEMVLFYTRAGVIGIYVRISMVIYALNLLRLYIVSIYEKLKENQELQRQLEFSRLELMNSQIKPHFIYNSLNSIRTLIRLNPDAAYDAVYDFSTYLRANLNSLKDDDLIPFRDELRNVTAYLNIEKLRLGKRLNTQFQIEEKDFLVPHLCIQPLVENAVKHGIWRNKEPGTVWITEYETESFHVIEITDDGTGFDTTMLETDSGDASEHIGIRNIRFRIEWLTDGTVDIRSEKGKGTRAVVRIPQNEIGRRRKERMKKDESDRG